MSLVVALSTTLGFAVIDHWLLVGARFGIRTCGASGCSCRWCSSCWCSPAPRLYARWYQPAIQIAAPLFGVGTVLMAVEATPEQLPLVAARLLLAAFYFYFMLGLTFGRGRPHQPAAGRRLCRRGAARRTSRPTVAIYSLFVLFCANLIGGAGCYALEYANRVAFLERRRLAEVAMHDGLTGLLNRAALEEQARACGSTRSVARLPVSVLLIDIDHFKAYNDRYGHQAGDRCLREVAAAVQPPRGGARSTWWRATAARRSSPCCSAPTAAHAGKPPRGVLRGGQRPGIAHSGSPTRPHVTVSVGVDDRGAGAEYSHDQAVQLADSRAVCSARTRGRDGWSCHDPAAGGRCRRTPTPRC